MHTAFGDVPVFKWWSKFEVLQQVHTEFEDVHVFLHNSDLPPVTTGKMLKIIDNQPTCRKLKMELTITVDTMEPLSKQHMHWKVTGR